MKMNNTGVSRGTSSGPAKDAGPGSRSFPTPKGVAMKDVNTRTSKASMTDVGVGSKKASMKETS